MRTLSAAASGSNTELSLVTSYCANKELTMTKNIFSLCKLDLHKRKYSNRNPIANNNNNNILLTPERLLQSSALFDCPLLRLQQVATPRTLS